MYSVYKVLNEVSLNLKGLGSVHVRNIIVSICFQLDNYFLSPFFWNKNYWYMYRPLFRDAARLTFLTPNYSLQRTGTYEASKSTLILWESARNKTFHMFKWWWKILGHLVLHCVTLPEVTRDPPHQDGYVQQGPSTSTPPRARIRTSSKGSTVQIPSDGGISWHLYCF